MTEEVGVGQGGHGAPSLRDGTQPWLDTRKGRTWATLRWVRDHWRDPLYRNSYLLLANMGVVTASGFVFWLVAARLAPADEVGLATSTLGAMMLVSLAARLGFDVAFLRFLPNRAGNESHSLINTAFTLSGGAAIVGALIFAGGTPWWSPALTGLRAPGAALGFAALTLVWTHGSLLDSVFVARQRADYALYKNILHSALKVGLVLVLAGTFQATGIVVGWTASMLVALIVAVVAWLPRTEGRFMPWPGVHPAEVRTVMSSSLANYLASIILFVPLSVGSLIVLHRFGAEQAAVFYVLWMFGAAAMMAPQAFSQASLVAIVRTNNPRILVLGKAGAVTIAAGILVLMAGWVLLPLFGPTYARQGIVPLVPFVLAAVPGIILFSRLARFRAAGRHTALILSTASCVLFFVWTIGMGPWGPAQSGWVWLAAVTAGAAVAMVST